ncbi:MAG: flagellar biosynthesis protein FliQ [Gemmatimonadota bacterium]|jgi:flagellar biosynthetic protein FliQ|nr:flagellar biosynthesis protein FliQ [Gemmatimonadota bacterium]
MSEALIVDLARKALTMTLMLSAPMLLVALVIGLAVGILQSVTQIQEQTLTYVPKLVGISVVFLLALPWMMQLTVKYTVELFRSLPTLIG